MNKITTSLIMGVLALVLTMPTFAKRHYDRHSYDQRHDRHRSQLVVTLTPDQIYFGTTQFSYYPNHLIVPSHYSERSIRDMARLSRHLGWHHVYLLPPGDPRGIPSRYHHYVNRYFGDYGIDYSFYSPYYDQYHSPYYYHYRTEPKSGFYFQFRF